MSNWFDVLAYVFEWCRTTYYVPIEILDVEFSFTILGLLSMPFFALLSIRIIKHIFQLANE